MVRYEEIREEGVRHRGVVDYVREEVVRYVRVVVVNVRVEQVEICVCVDQEQIRDESGLTVELVNRDVGSVKV